MAQQIRIFAIAIGASRDRQDLQRHNTTIAGAILFLPRDGESCPLTSFNESPTDVMVGSGAVFAGDANSAKQLALEKAFELFPACEGWARHCAFVTDITQVVTIARELADITQNYQHAQG